MPTPRKPNPKPGGRPPTDPAVLDAALAAIEKGEAPEKVTARLGVSATTIYREQRRRKGAPLSKPTMRSSSSEPDRRPPASWERPPANLTGSALRVWYTQRRIEGVSQALADAEAEGNLARIAPLNEQLRKWLDDLAKFSPPEAKDPAEEDRRYRAQGEEVLRKIESGVSAVEERQRRERERAQT